MAIVPFLEIDGISLDTSSRAVMEIKGHPNSIKTNSLGLTEIDFGSCVYRFDKEDRLYEVTLNTPSIKLAGVSVTFEQLGKYVKQTDNNWFDKYGFIVSPKFGVAFDPEHSPFLTVLTKLGLQGWKDA
ncbi:hypothetical protein I2702_004822 [Vibrio parahaemolyticus]|nr:hypothetical protein [Vibrio parahaemolyticus]